MSKVINLADLQAEPSNSGGSVTQDKPKANFLADDLLVTVTTPEGTVVLETVLKSRGFAAKVDKRSGKEQGGIGWYGDINGDDCGTYRGLPVSAGLRLSIAGKKFAPGDTIDLRTPAKK